MKWPSQVALVVKNLSANVGDTRDSGSIPELGRSLQECMATHSRILAWPGRLQSMGRRELDMTEVTNTHALGSHRRNQASPQH